MTDALATLGVALAFGALGIALWTRFVRPGLQPLLPDDTVSTSAMSFLVAMGVNLLASNLLVVAGGVPPDGAELPLQRAISAQAAGNLAAVLVLLALLQRMTGRGRDVLGLRGRPGTRPLLGGLAAWLLLPAIVGAVQVVNGALHRLFGAELEEQLVLQRFLAEGARDPVVWLCAALVIPFSEEVLFRGALHGGLRRLLGPLGAALLSGALFGLMHEPSAMLPVAALGVYLALLYERTGSLVVPTLVHGLHNGLTLAFLVLSPEPMP